MYDENSVIQTIIKSAESIIILENAGFIISPDEKCKFNNLFILKSFVDLYENENTCNILREKINLLYNHLI